ENSQYLSLWLETALAPPKDLSSPHPIRRGTAMDDCGSDHMPADKTGKLWIYVVGKKLNSVIDAQGAQRDLQHGFHIYDFMEDAIDVGYSQGRISGIINRKDRELVDIMEICKPQSDWWRDVAEEEESCTLCSWATPIPTSTTRPAPLLPLSAQTEDAGPITAVPARNTHAGTAIHVDTTATTRPLLFILALCLLLKVWSLWEMRQQNHLARERNMLQREFNNLNKKRRSTELGFEFLDDLKDREK
ncbi:hypothetical protein QBC34DRAFT_455000, partial [Podospora aff. communis PSN243]